MPLTQSVLCVQKEESAEPVHQEKAKLVNSQQKVAQRIYMERRRPNRHIPVIRYHPKYVITNTNDDFDDHDEIIMWSRLPLRAGLSEDVTYVLQISSLHLKLENFWILTSRGTYFL